MILTLLFFHKTQFVGFWWRQSPYILTPKLCHMKVFKIKAARLVLIFIKKKRTYIYDAHSVFWG
jgi:hypothetical protein